MLILCMLFLLLSYFKKKYRKEFILLSALVLIVFATFREDIFSASIIGNDYYSYRNWFGNISNIRISITNDFLFNILMLIVSKITGSYIVFIFVTSSIWVYSLYKFSIDNSKNYVFTIFLMLTFGIFELGWSAIRQAMAISVFLLSFKYIGQKKFWKYAIGIVIAGLFHSSALLMILVYPFVNLNIKLIYKIGLIVLAIVSFIILVNTGIYENILVEYLPNYTIKYAGIGDGLKSNYTCFAISIITIAMLYFFKNSRQNLAVLDNSIVAYLLLMILFAYLATLHVTLGRMLQYFMPAIALGIPSILYFEKGKNLQKLASVSVVLLFSIMYCM